MKLIESLDEALYSVMSWLVFYPLTLWRTVVRPLDMMGYADREMSDQPDDQYDDAIRPPLFLFLTLLISHGIEVAVTGQNVLIKDRHGLAALVDSDLALLALRLLFFSLFTMTMTVRMLTRNGIRLTHRSLRRPFYGQCFAAAPFALLVGIGSLLTGASHGGAKAAGIAVIIAAFAWYLAVQSRWFAQKLGVPVRTGLVDALIATAFSVVLSLAVAILVVA